MSKKLDLQGQKFGRLLVVSRAPNNKHNKVCWNVLCDCGIKKIVIGYLLSGGRLQSCGCLQKDRASEANKKFDSNPALRKLIDSYRNSAKRRGFNFLLSVDEADKLFRQPCFYCARAPHRSFTEYNGRYKYIYNGIDRIDNSKDYTIENIRACCKDCNYAKNEMSVEEFANWIRKVYENFVR